MLPVVPQDFLASLEVLEVEPSLKPSLQNVTRPQRVLRNQMLQDDPLVSSGQPLDVLDLRKGLLRELATVFRILDLTHEVIAFGKVNQSNGLSRIAHDGGMNKGSAIWIHDFGKKRLILALPLPSMSRYPIRPLEPRKSPLLSTPCTPHNLRLVPLMVSNDVNRVSTRLKLAHTPMIAFLHTTIGVSKEHKIGLFHRSKPLKHHLLTRAVASKDPSPRKILFGFHVVSNLDPHFIAFGKKCQVLLKTDAVLGIASV